MKTVRPLVLFAGLTAVSCAGRFVDVDPFYPPVQQVHQSYYKQPHYEFKGKQLAVLDFKGDDGQGQVFADMLATQLFHEGFDVVERQNVEVLLNEIRMAQSGAQDLSESQLLRKIGRMAGVDIVIVGGVVQYVDEIYKWNDLLPVLPFSVPRRQFERRGKRYQRAPSGMTTFRWKPGEYKTPSGLPVAGTIYASARAIDVKTGRIVWIDTVNVQTHGITRVTGLERLGKVMAGNLAGTRVETTAEFIWTGERFRLPDNWDELHRAWRIFLRIPADED